MTLTAEQIDTAAEILAYAVDKLRAVELQHEANPAEIFAELLGQLVEAEYKAQAAESVADQLGELIGAIWGDNMPAEVNHTLTVERARDLCAIEVAATAHEPEPETSPEHFAGATESAGTEGGDNAG